VRRLTSFALALSALASAACSSTSAVTDAGGPDAGAIDAGPDVDNGAPSTDYPAPHPPLPRLVNAKMGPVLTAPKVKLVFFPGYMLEQDLQAFAQAMTKTAYWGAIASEYGIGALGYAGTVDRMDAPPATISQADLGAWFASELKAGAFGTPDPQTIYTLFFPASTTITQPNPISPILGTVNSCSAFLGYHDDVDVALGDAGTTSFAYAVIPTCGPLGSLTETISHEWIEAATDPLVSEGGVFTLTGGPRSAFYGPDQDHLVWALLAGGESADLCNPEGASAYITPSDLMYSVERSWSNVSAKASHDPCVPNIPGAYFAAAPVLDEDVTVDSMLTGKVTTKGVHIAMGASRTIEVDLFSDGDTGGPWVVTADDVLATYYGSYGLKPSLSFSWDRTRGQNGEKLHLTITVIGTSPVAGAHAFMITSLSGKRKTVWPGLVVE